MIYIGYYKGTSLFERIIRMFRHSSYTHACIISGEEKIEAVKKGLRKTSKMNHPRKWVLEIYQVKGLTEEQANRIWEDAEKDCENNHGYDFPGVIRFRIPFIRHSRRRYFCSEHVEDKFRKEGYILTPGKRPCDVAPDMQQKSSYLLLKETVFNK